MTKSVEDLYLAKANTASDPDKRSYTETIAKLKGFLSERQLAFVEDKHRFKIARCGRRAGKSIMDVIYLLIRALEDPLTPVLYLGLTRESAKNTVWDFLIYILTKFNIQHEARVSELRINLENGSFIRLFGADTSNARERLRGQKFALIIIDEMGFYQGADYLIEVLLPMLADYAGTMCMTSSPGVALSGFFYEADVGKQAGSWHQYHWTLRDNPHFMQPAENPRVVILDDGAEYRVDTMGDEEILTIVNTLYGRNWSHPGFRREYLGLWVEDGTSRVYPASANTKIPDGTHLQHPLYGIGIDLGSVSENAIVVVEYSQYSREVYVVHVWKQADVRVDALGSILEDLVTKYDPTFIVADTGGYGRGIVDELRYRFSLPITAADKQDKAWYQNLVGEDLISNYIKVWENAGLPLLQEWSKIVKDEIGIEVRGQANHAADAFLYIYRRVYQVHLSAFATPKTEEQKMLDHVTKAYLQQQQIVREEDSYDA